MVHLETASQERQIVLPSRLGIVLLVLVDVPSRELLKHCFERIVELVELRLGLHLLTARGCAKLLRRPNQLLVAERLIRLVTGTDEGLTLLSLGHFPDLLADMG